MADQLCATCTTEITSDQRSVHCLSCKKYFHTKCKSLNGANLQSIKKHGYFCSDPCLTNGNVPRMTTNDPQISTQNDTNEQQITSNDPFQCEDPDNPTPKEIFGALKAIGGFCDRVQAVEKKQQQLEVNLEIVQQNVCRIDDTQNDMASRMKSMELELNWLKQEKLRCNATLAGIPFHNNDYMSCLQSIGNRIGMSNICTKVKKVTCLSKNNNIPTKTLLIEFSNHESKELFIQKKKVLHPIFPQQVDLGESTRPLSIRDHLTRFFMDVYKKAALVKDDIKFQFLWIQNGRILMKKEEKSKDIYWIQTKDDLERLKQTLETAQP
jgi:hypothetical protein